MSFGTLSKDDKKAQAQENHQANERLHQLVVKIISWRTGPAAGGTIDKANKITPQEWSLYKKHLLNISKTESPERVKEKLDSTYKAIKNRGGFK